MWSRGTRLCFFSSLPETVTRLGQLQPAGKMSIINSEHAQNRSRLRGQFGKFGVSSGVNMARLWPSVEEVEEEMTSTMLMEWNDAVREVELIRSDRDKRAKARYYHGSIEKNEKNYASALSKFQTSQQKAEKEKDEREAVLERRMREIHEYFGYWMDPKDPRFEVMLQQKETEEKKAEKLAKRADQQKKKIAEVLSQ